MIRQLCDCVVNIYSEVNPQFDAIFEISCQSDEYKAIQILSKAYDKWFELETSEPWGEYLEDALYEAGIQYDVYYKKGE